MHRANYYSRHIKNLGFHSLLKLSKVQCYDLTTLSTNVVCGNKYIELKMERKKIQTNKWAMHLKNENKATFELAVNQRSDALFVFPALSIKSKPPTDFFVTYVVLLIVYPNSCAGGGKLCVQVVNKSTILRFTIYNFTITNCNQ